MAAAAQRPEEVQVQRIDGLVGKERFSAIESVNVPALFVGAVKGWAASSLWEPRAGGLDYLQRKVGSETVDAMLSRSGSVFYGYLGGHEPTPLSFSEFIELCRRNLQLSEQDDRTGAGELKEVSSTTNDDNVYLAQIPIMSAENDKKSVLIKLIDDIEMPIFLDGKELVSINLWMSNVRSRSSIHYDPHHNILCVVSGRKQAGRTLYPMAVYGEASNHSSLDIQNPDFSRYPRAKGYIELSQKAILHSGDALFIPEGWFHQVDSDDLTLAVNFWWESPMMSNMLQHMDAYYLRIISNRLMSQEMRNLISSGMEDASEETTESFQPASKVKTLSTADNNRDKRDSENKGLSLEHLEPMELQALNEVLSLVYEGVNVSGCNESMQGPPISPEDNSKNVCPVTTIDDPVAHALYKMKICVLRKVFLAMAHNFPRTLEALVLHSLSPIAAEVLTTKFHILDLKSSKEEQSEFYQQFYSVFDDPFVAMDSILNKKESFAFQAFRNVLNQYLGVDVSKPQQ
ncbi:2-oxoglutarate (2OG) and Fe(II)-dependent oxygenase superfamily protein isoform X2 [Wolffia australiana]